MTDLLTNLEQAEFCNKSLMLSVCEHLGVNIHTMVLNGRTTLWTLIDARAWESTAIALIEEVLPDWRWAISEGARASLQKGPAAISRGSIPIVAKHKSAPIALLICLLKALETGGDHD